MAVLRCRMCGGEIRTLDPRVGVCESCGTRVLLPLIDEDRIRNLYNRGNHFRDVGEYDRAYSAYESVIAENRDDPEAHWCLLLCRYGVNYVRDERKGDFRPTISRMNRTPILEDPDYLAALRCSEGEMRAQYQKEAAQLAALQNRFLEIMRQEQPYDVFICFRAENPDGTRTQASEIGQNIYEVLTAKGLRVFFSRITLEDKIGAEFEPYIFSALYTAKVMLVVANEAWQLTARWVKNEWIRFLALMDSDPSKAIIPVFSGMDPYDFPPEIPTVQGQDMSRLGSMQDLTKNVLRLVGKAPKTVVLEEDPGKKAPLNLDNLLERTRIYLEDEDFDEAKKRLDSVLEADPENADAQYYQLLLKNQARTWRDLMEKGHEWTETAEFQAARKKKGSGRVQQELDALEHACRTERNYLQAEKLMEERSYDQALPILQELGDYKSAPAMLSRCEEAIRQKARVKDYIEEVGDGRDYIARRLMAEHPKEYQKMQRLRKRRNYTFAPKYLNFGLWPLIAAIAVMGVLGFLIMRGMTIERLILIIWACGFLLLGILVGFIFESVIAGIVVVAALTWGASFLPNKILVSAGLVIGVVVVLVCAVCSVRSARWKSVRKEEERYYHNVIEPLEDKITEEIKQKWEPIVGAENLIYLYSIRYKED